MVLALLEDREQQAGAEAVCLCQMQTLVKVAGPNILKLRLTDEHLKHLDLVPRLQVLHVIWDSDAGKADFSFLNILQDLAALHISVRYLDQCSRSMLVTGLPALPRLRAVHITNGLAVDLPVSITELTMRNEWERQTTVHNDYKGQADRFRAWFPTFQGQLSRVCLDMHVYGCDPGELQHSAHSVPCLRDVSHLELFFAPDSGVRASWPSGFFRRLETLQLAFGETVCTFSPVWDLSSCGKLRSLVVSIDAAHPKRLCLAHITGVTADLFELHFKSERKESSPRLNFTTWNISQASIKYDHSFRLGLPSDVTDTLGALLCMASVPAITVNGTTPAVAAAAAAAGGLPAPHRCDASSSADSYDCM